MELRALKLPIVQAPLAGGPSTPRLAAAIAQAGGLGFLAAGYKTPDALAADIRELRSLTGAPFGINIFVPPAPPDDGSAEAVARYAAGLEGEEARYGVSAGVPRHDDDHFDAKLELVLAEPPAVVSFTFGYPDREILDQLRAAGSDVWITVTTLDEAQTAAQAGVDALVVQGTEAGGHRGSFSDPPQGEQLPLLTLLRMVAGRTSLPLVGAGGIADGATLAAVLTAGAAAGQIGTALMLSPEAGTSAPHRAALKRETATALTRAFSGRQARGIVNRFMLEHESEAPLAYPDVNYITAPIRAAARAASDPEALNLWAGQAHALAREAPAAEIAQLLVAEARAATAATAARLELASS
jgi:nitronate monooxygenase